MKPVRTAHSNLVYVGPPGVGDLHCERTPSGIWSVWYLTAAERAAVAAGANIGLLITVEPIPPVAMVVTDEAGAGEDDPAVLARMESVG